MRGRLGLRKVQVMLKGASHAPRTRLFIAGTSAVPASRRPAVSLIQRLEDCAMRFNASAALMIGMRWKILRSSRCASPETIRSASAAIAVAKHQVVGRIAADRGSNHGWHDDRRDRSVTLQNFFAAQRTRFQLFCKFTARKNALRFREQGRTGVKLNSLCLDGVDQLARRAMPENLRDCGVGIEYPAARRMSAR